MDNRITAIDVLRGFALTGLPVINLVATVGEDRYPSPDPWASVIYHDLVYQRFLTIFCYLFGVSFALVLRAAVRRTPHPRRVLARRLGALLLISAVQLFALDGNLQLAVYASLGLLVLLPTSWLPRRAPLVLGLLAIAVSAPITDIDPENGASPLKVLIEWSGLLLLGAVTVRYGLHRDPTSRPRSLRLVLTTSTVVAATALLVHAPTATVPGAVLAECGLLATSAAYVSALLLLLRTRAARALAALLAPLGRMALTCFLTQAAAATVLAALLDVRSWNYAVLTFALPAAFMLIQSLVCSWWLRSHRYGPVEWWWRCATWWTWAPDATGVSSAEGPSELPTRAARPSRWRYR